MKLKRLSKPLFIRRVSGRSMLPSLRGQQIVLASSFLSPTENKAIIIKHKGVEKIKRLKTIKGRKIFVVGDNLTHSTDSRSFGNVDIDQVIGTVIYPRI